MKWINYVLLVGYLFLSSLTTSVLWAQPQHKVAPTEGTASMEGRVVDAQTKQPLAGAIVIAKNQEGAVRTQQSTVADGAYQLILDPKQTYIITTKADGYITLDEQWVFTSSKADRVIRKPTLLFRFNAQQAKAASSPTAKAPPVPTPPVSTQAASQPPVASQPIAGNAPTADNQRVAPPKTLDAKVVYTPPLIVAAVGKTTQLRALQFVQSKTELLPDAQPALEQLLQFMQGQPTVEIELSGHTDNQGDFDENLKLSKQRVDVVKDYLVKSGIAANRITTRGYGPTRPIASNNSETTRQQNRRVEMIVVKQ
ncbi:OmpA family protein [Spirosoma pollinicola]|uniref:Flagellar motor protein MotB n=1 Tax=Spirosoma pollinicola TaxID=2057025 RepID=A0A2K8ZB72_9BACT|nr:OmpA family protein [Spirosoma pollinicola]AUD07132.1 flagellar motor protein MotB [Spirosoma pollinicola]